MADDTPNPATVAIGDIAYRHVDLAALLGPNLARVPWVIRVLVENLARTGSASELAAALAAVADWLEAGASEAEIAFRPGRVLMHDTTCVPALVDIAAMRDALAEAGHDPSLLNPVLRVDVSIDHSVAVDAFAVPDALARNMATEISRNAERYRMMKWAAANLRGFRVHPPGTGIMHTLNLEQLATVITETERDGARWLMPDTLLGTDSHTPMINGIGVLAWGIGGIEAESVMFGMPAMLRLPDVVGVRLKGRLSEGTLGTDLALAVTELLRGVELGGAFVEFFGPGVSSLTAGDRAVVANMAPEYGAGTGYFPVDEAVMTYLAATGRSPAAIERARIGARAIGLWFDPEAEPRYTRVLDLDLTGIGPSLAGPKRPQDRLSPSDAPAAIERAFRPLKPDGDGVPDGAVAIAAITSCTNTTDPRLLIAAGLLARNARRAGLRPPPWVKTSLAPGSPSAARYLERAGLRDDLAAIGFDIVGFGCATCIGNSGALTPSVAAAVANGTLAVAVLSGNRNFPGRVHPDLEAGFLAAPPLVIAFALAGDVNRDILRDPIGIGPEDRPIRLADIWPSGAEIDAALARAAHPADVPDAFDAAEASPVWAALETPSGDLFSWNRNSTYLQPPPFASQPPGSRLGAYGAHPLLVLGDDMTTDHISPAGQIRAKSEAGRYLIAQGDPGDDLNVYASRRGNWNAMLRGLFDNRAVRNLLAPDCPPGTTIHVPSGDRLTLSEAAARYRNEGASTVIVAGARFGMGSSRDWAAKGQALLGIRAVLARSFERIHRSNLIGMGILPLRLPDEVTPETLALQPGDVISVDATPAVIAPRSEVSVVILRVDGSREPILCRAAVETELEADQLRAGGIIPIILRAATAASKGGPACCSAA